jgi:hypothetical protein
LKTNKFINITEYRKIFPVNYCLPNFYELIKNHKPGNPCRIICPYFEYPASKLSKFLSNLITPSVRNSEYSLKDSSEFASIIKGFLIQKHEIMMPLYVINLFTNIPMAHTLEILKDKLKMDVSLRDRTSLPIEAIFLVRLCMENNFFSFNEKFNWQKTGAGMGCNLSPVIAETLVEHLFKKVMSTFHSPPRLLKYFVDDSFMIIDRKCEDLFFEHISKMGLSLKTIRFAIEKESPLGKLPFLDLMIDRSENRIQTSIYRKPTHSNRYLNFRSHHSLESKKSVMRTLINRAFTHCTDDIRLKKELDYLRDILTENNYPLKQCFSNGGTRTSNRYAKRSKVVRVQ